MTAPLNDRTAGPFACTGGERVFGYDFRILAATDLAVWRRRAGADTLLAYGIDYTVSGVGVVTGGLVTLTADSIAGDQVTLDGARPHSRATDLTSTTGFRHDALNTEYDSHQIQLQEIRRDIGRTLRRAPTAGAVSPIPSGSGYLTIGSDGSVGIVADAPAGADPIAADMIWRAAYASAQDAANLAGGKMFSTLPGDTINLAVPATYASVQAALDAISRWWIAPGSRVNINITGHLTAPSHIARLMHPFSDRIKFRGVPAVETTFSQVSAVTGGPGAWDVSVVVPDPSLFEVNDWAYVYDVTPGVKAPGEYVGLPKRGEMRLGFFAAGSLNRAYFKSVGTTVTIWMDAACTTTPADQVNLCVQNGDLVCVYGQVRSISGVGPAGFTLNAALQRDVSGLQYWYHLPRSAQGTVTIASGVITGNSTLFSSQYNVHDEIAVVGAGIARITAITAESGSSCITTSPALPDVTTASYGVIVSGELHGGGWRVIGKSGSTITWRNTCRPAFSQPPVRSGAAAHIAGKIAVLKSSVGTTGAFSGFQVQNAVADIDHLALYGTGLSATSVGVDLRGIDQGDPAHPAGIAFLHGHLKAGLRTIISGFGWNIVGMQRSHAAVDYVMICNAVTRGVDNNFGSNLTAKGATFAGNGGFGVMNGPRSMAELSDARFLGNADDGLRNIKGQYYAEFPIFTANGGDAIALDGAGSIHHNGAKIIKHPNGDGVGSDNGGTGRQTGVITIDAAVAISYTNAQVELTQNQVFGCPTAIIGNNSRLNFSNSGIGNGASHAVRSILGADMKGMDVQINNRTFGLSAEGTRSIINMPDVALGGANVSMAANAVRCEINIKGYVNAGSFTPATLNRLDANWNAIIAGNDVGTVPQFDGIEIGATDTTLARLSAGDLSVEGNRIFRAGGADVPVADGGTGASTKRAAAANLGTWHVIASSAVAIVHTGTTAKTALVTVPIPGGAKGPNGAVRVSTMWSYTNSANTKTLWVDHGTNAFSQASVTTSASIQLEHTIQNRNSESSQVGFVRTATTPYATSTGAPQTGNTNTASNFDITIAATLANSGETVTLERHMVEVYYQE